MRRLLPGDSWRLFAAAALFLVVILGFFFGLQWYLGHAVSREEARFYLWAAALIAAVSYTVARWILGAKTVDGFVNRVLNVVTFGGWIPRE
jgi:hypothetical protein